LDFKEQVVDYNDGFQEFKLTASVPVWHCHACGQDFSDSKEAVKIRQAAITEWRRQQWRLMPTGTLVRKVDESIVRISTDFGMSDPARPQQVDLPLYSIEIQSVEGKRHWRFWRQIELPHSDEGLARAKLYAVALARTIQSLTEGVESENG
jgi:hypothetical protein